MQVLSMVERSIVSVIPNYTGRNAIVKFANNTSKYGQFCNQMQHLRETFQQPLLAIIIYG